MQDITIGIIGAGISGIASAKEAIKNGYNVQLFEKNESIGGVWYSKSYPGCRIQTSKESYKYSDIEYDEDVPLYPDRDEIISYLEKTINKFNLNDKIYYNCNVINTEFIKSSNKWKIEYYKNNETTKPITFICDYLIIATGFYGETPNSQEIIKNKDLLKHKIFFPGDFSYTGTQNINMLKDKSVVIIGNGPTGCDLAAIANDHNAKKISVIYRSKRWIFQRYLWKTLSVHLYFTNRYFFCCIDIIPNKLYSILLVLYYYVVFLLLHGNFLFFPVPYGKRVNRSNFVLNESFVNLVYNKKIDYIQTNKVEIDDDFVLTDIKAINYDVCILATGYKNSINCMKMDNIPLLYKHIIHPYINNCAFIGFIGTFNCMQAYELQAKWYMKHLNDISNLSTKNMQNYIECEYKKKKSKKIDYHDMLFDYVMDYYDDICKECDITQKYKKYDPRYWLIPQGPNLLNY